jgi:nitrous-oxide reductase
MATGGIQQGKPPLEVGASQLDFDYLHIIDWKKAEQVVAAGKFQQLNGIRVISLETAAAEGILHLAPEPRSPHGVDVAPKGDYISVSGKLDPHVTVYSIDLIKKAIAAKSYEGKDRYGVPARLSSAPVRCTRSTTTRGMPTRASISRAPWPSGR